ncbi:hypothetical protein HF313_07500 [Massilia atriviolacea]|nr:putative Ig domain-containing protein [Massilia atriviolacea]
MTPILIDGDDTNNSLYGTAAPEAINGRGGDDFLYGGEGNDTLDGGTGKDVLDGGAGNNTYRWGIGSGQDSIQRGVQVAAGHSVLELGEGVFPSTLNLLRMGQDLVLSIAGSGDTLRLPMFFMQGGGSDGLVWNYPVSLIRFADGSAWDVDAIHTRAALGTPALLLGGSGNDTLQGSPEHDVLRGGAGDDVLRGGGGDDWFDGGAGNDLLDGGSGGGYDTVRFGYGSGQDTVAAPAGGLGDVLTVDLGAGVQAATLVFLRAGAASADLVIELPLSGERLTVKDYFSAQRHVTLHFADGGAMSKATIDQRAGDALAPRQSNGTALADTLYGGSNSDILRGGAGDDVLLGYFGDDLLVGGEGNDLLDASEGNDYVDGGAGDDRIQTGSGATVVLFGRASGHDEVAVAPAGGPLTVLLEAGIGLADITLARSENGHDLLVGVGGQQAGLRVAFYFAELPGNPVAPFSLQFADGVVWDGALIERVLAGGDGGDNLLDGTAGNDRLDGGAGNDQLRGLQGNDALLGGAGNDLLLGGEGDDTLDGGQGDDFLDDGFGNNTYVFARGDGRDTILNNTPLPQMRYQSIAFSDGIRPEQVHLQRVGYGTWDDLVITIDGQPEQVIEVRGFIYNDPLYATNQHLNEIRFADGSKWDSAAIFARLNLGTEAGESIGGSALADRIEAKGGNDTLTGGRGDDLLDGGAGADTYVFKLGDGRDTLVDTREAGGPGNTVRFGAGITQQDVRVEQAGAGLQIAYGTGGDLIVLANSGAGQQPVERLQFADGSTRLLGDYSNHAPQLKLALPDQHIAPGQAFKLTLPAGMFVDPDAGDLLRLSVSQSAEALPSWLSFDAASNTLQGTAPPGLQTSYQLRVMAKDLAGLTATDDFTLTVGGSNSTPYVKAPIGPIAVNENGRFGVRTPTFGDADAGDTLSVKVTLAGGAALPSWLSFDGKELLAGAPGFEHAGSYKLSATATDQGGLSVSSNFDLVVKNVNRAPQPTQALAPLEAAQGTPFSGVLPARLLADPDGDAVSYKLALAGGAPLPAWLAFDPATRTLSGTPSGADAPALSLLLTGTDSAGLSGSSSFKLNVAADAVQALNGTAGADALNGLSAGDTLLGLAGNDQLYGFAGNDLLDGGLGADRMTGGTGNDRYIVDASGDVVVELANEGRDTVVATVVTNLAANAEVLVLGGSAALAGYGNAGDNILNGNSASNMLNGNGGNDILQGGAGNDTLTDTLGKNVFDGGLGADIMNGGSGAELFIGGAGNDTITPGSGIDIIAFNRGDGLDAVNQNSGLDNVISLGGGIGFGDLTFKRTGSDLVLGTGAGEQITLRAWYTSNVHTVARLQMFIEGTSDYQSAAPLSLNSQKIQLFNFDALAAKFDQALAANPDLGSWSLAPELAGALIRSSGNTAIGGDLAQQYASTGTLGNVAQVPALAIIGSASFGDANQSLAGSPLGLADGSAFLM